MKTLSLIWLFIMLIFIVAGFFGLFFFKEYVPNLWAMPIGFAFVTIYDQIKQVLRW